MKVCFIVLLGLWAVVALSTAEKSTEEQSIEKLSEAEQKAKDKLFQQLMKELKHEVLMKELKKEMERRHLKEKAEGLPIPSENPDNGRPGNPNRG